MKTAIIVGSPKASGSASQEFGAELLRQLEGKAECALWSWNTATADDGELEAFAACDAAVFVFPLYVDGIPSHLLHILQRLERTMDQTGGGPRIYAIVNAGFFEGDQNRLALEMLQHWCARAGLAWGMGIGIGGGPMLSGLSTPLGKGPKQDMGAAYRALVSAILSEEQGENRFASPGFPRKLYRMAAHMGWRAEGRKYGLKTKQLYRKALADR